MKMILMMADAGRWPAIREEIQALGAPGYSAIPVLEGAGRTGVHAGDRIHPGGLVAVFIVEPDPPATQMFESLVRQRDAARDRVSRLYLLPVEREA